MLPTIFISSFLRFCVSSFSSTVCSYRQVVKDSKVKSQYNHLIANSFVEVRVSQFGLKSANVEHFIHFMLYISKLLSTCNGVI